MKTVTITTTQAGVVRKKLSDAGYADLCAALDEPETFWILLEGDQPGYETLLNVDQMVRIDVEP